MSDYATFLERKRITDPSTGLTTVPPLNPMLFEFQRDIVAWALKRGRAAIFADCGLGKTPMQLEWARHIPGKVLILAPLAVSLQTQREGDKFGITVGVARKQDDVREKITVTNYEMLEHFDFSEFGGLVLDESSILKAHDGKTRTRILELSQQVPFRLACTATPAPNDYMELGNHAEYLGSMSRVEMLSMFFVHDGGETQKWRLKGHAQTEFWKWICSWAVMVRKPSDLGYSDEGFTLPELIIHEVNVRVDEPTSGFLFPVEASTLQERLRARRDTITDRVRDCAAIVNAVNCRHETNRQIGIHEVVSLGQSGQVEANPGAASEGECSSSRTLCDGGTAANSGKDESEGVANLQSGEAEESAVTRLRHRLGGPSESDGGTTGALCDLRVLGHEQTEDISNRGSLSQERECTRIALPELQSGNREVQRQHRQPLFGSDVLAEKFIVWCGLNDEADAVEKAIPGAVQVSGTDSIEQKEKALRDFQDGRVETLVSKTSIFGFGLNLQVCRNVIFLGLSDSYEAFYQAVRRCWRFGQKRPVNVYVITAETEGAVVANIKRKEADAMKMAEEMVAHMRDMNIEALHGATERQKTAYERDVATGDGFEAHLVDCVDLTAELAEASIDYTIYSPPFSSLYTYSNSDRDMGNCTDDSQFIEHYRFLVEQLFRITKPGRLLSFHCMNLPTSKQHHGYIGIRDFRGELIKIHQAAGFIFHSEVVIWKDPVTAMQRTKALGLLHKQLRKDSCMSRQGIPDYLVTMRKPGDNAGAVSHTSEDFPVQLWQNYASPVWMDINPSDTLQFRSAREHNDERHICPLQLEVIRRALKLWTNPADLVYSPFMGIGSEGYCAVQSGRNFIGAELKRSYWQQAVKNLASAKSEQGAMFDHFDGEAA